MTTPYVAPTHSKKGFNCPICGAYANQYWFICVGRGTTGAPTMTECPGFTISKCTHCNELTFWFNDKIIYPHTSTAPLPNPDLPEEILTDYLEASSIAQQSPRGAAALLRLCIHKLCKHLGEKGENLNDDIASLVKKGLNAKVQQSLDIVRIIGNNAVHPGQIDLKDDTETANKLFNLVNLIANAMITQPKEVDGLFNSLPKNNIDAIKKRDDKK